MKIETWYSPDESCRVLDVDQFLRGMEINPDAASDVEFDVSRSGLAVKVRLYPDTQAVTVEIIKPTPDKDVL